MLRNQTFQRMTSSVVLTAFVSMTLAPLNAAARTYDAAEEAGLLARAGSAPRPTHALSPDERFAQLLTAMHEEVKAAVPQMAMSPAAHVRHDKNGSESRALLVPFAGTDAAARMRAIRGMAREARALFPEVEQGFKDTEQHLAGARLAPVMSQRNAEAAALFASRRAQFEQLADSLERAEGEGGQRAALDGLGAFMAKSQSAKSHQYGNPNKLPFALSERKVRAPKASKEQFEETLFSPQTAQATQATLSLAVPGAADPADLGETDEVQLTPAVKAQALALHRNPVEIYNWVRNNIEFVPSYGSIQGSEMTLHNKRGNAFDTASLLIALYRASGIPARYVYGTVDVPAARVMNWVGGMSTPEAAQSLLGQGGIPNVGILSAGAINTIRMEHVWVQAYVDYAPSRAAVNRAPATWVPVDASFKQYQFKPGMNVSANLPFDGAQLLAQAQQGATVDLSQGFVQNLNLPDVQGRINAYQAQVKAYVDSQQAGASVTDVIGGPKTIVEEHAILLGTLPYTTVAVGQTFSSMPDRLRWKFKTNIYAADGLSDAGSPIIELSQPTAKLAGKKITLSFVAATQADQDLINSYLPKAHADGSPILPSEMPTSLPGYLLKMKAEFRVDGQVVAQTTQSFSMGSEVMQSAQFYNPAHASWNGGEDNPVTVGEYNAIGIDLQGMGGQQLSSHQAKLEATKAKMLRFQLNPADISALDGVGKEEVTGDILQSGILGYFAQIDASDKLTARVLGNVATYRLPSYGRFFTAAQTTYWFGIAKKVTFPGIGIDVDYIAYHTEAKDGDRNKRTSFIRFTSNASSAAEHAVPEALFRNPNISASDPSQPQGISAIKALSVAAAQGQRIYTLGDDNRAQHGAIVQGLQISQDVKWEISNALASGMEVTVHEHDVSVGGWSGSGYIILDPLSGAGAYKIAGGANGGGVWWLGAIGGASIALVLGIASFLAAIAVGTAGAVVFFWVLILAVVLANVALMMMNWVGMTDEDKACYLGGILTGFGFAGLFSLPGWLGKLLAVLGIGFTGGGSTSPGQSCGAW